VEVKNESPNIKSDVNDQIFSISVRVDGGEKELVFDCIDKENKDLWVNVCKYGLAQIDQEWEYMTTAFSVDIEFRKEKLGFRVRELILDPKSFVEAAGDFAVDKPEDSTHVETEFVTGDSNPTEEPDEKAVVEQSDASSNDDDQKKSVLECVEEHETVEIESVDVSEIQNDKEYERPCEQLVTELIDKDLFLHGLVKHMKL